MPIEISLVLVIRVALITLERLLAGSGMLLEPEPTNWPNYAM